MYTNRAQHLDARLQKYAQTQHHSCFICKITLSLGEEKTVPHGFWKQTHVTLDHSKHPLKVLKPYQRWHQTQWKIRMGSMHSSSWDFMEFTTTVPTCSVKSPLAFRVHYKAWRNAGTAINSSLHCSNVIYTTYHGIPLST
eukprot:scpid108771/ scgid8398/ 